MHSKILRYLRSLISIASLNYSLLNDDSSWAVVTAINVEAAPLTAYNMKVSAYHTYFVTGDIGASPVWVHNDCFVGQIDFDPVQLQAKYKHAEDFGIDGNYNKQNAAKFEEAINSHRNDPSTTTQGTYLRRPESKILFNPNTNNVVVVGKDGKFITGFKLTPGTPQYIKFINDGILR